MFLEYVSTGAEENQALKFFCNEISNKKNPLVTLKKLCGGLRPSRTRVEINEKLVKVIFKLSEQGILRLLNGETFHIIEKKGYKNYGDIRTSYQILNSEGYQVQRPFTLFDRFVLSACISEWLEGNSYTTPAVIYRALTGKVDKGCDAKPSKDQLAAILDSIKILMCRIIKYNAKDLGEVMNYNDGTAFSLNGPFLPAVYFDASEESDADAIAIFFLVDPPLLHLAQIKRQLISYDSRLLDIPRQQNTPMNIELKNYCLLRVREICAHKQLTPTITFHDVFKTARIENSNGKTKFHAREFIKILFDHLQKKHVIGAFEIVKNNRGFHSIQFDRPKK